MTPDAAFLEFFEALTAFQARHRALAEQMATDVGLPASEESLRLALHAAITELVVRAQAAGALRADIGPADVAMLFSGVAHATSTLGPLEPALRERYMRIILDGLRPDGASPAPGPAARLRRAPSREASQATHARMTALYGTSNEPNHNTDPRRWLTLAIVIMAAFIVVLDNSVLYVAIPTILREFHTTLPSLQWVVTGYSLTFATLLIIGGRLGDVYGHRRIFIIGAALFGLGSFVASISQSVPQLVLGEAIIEGVGAALMMPATLAILSGTFSGRERGTAFAMWGATAGVGVAFGPVIGGFLTTNYSWRWAFRINVIVVPIAIIGALLFMRRGHRGERSLGIDVPGAILVATGMFLLVFGLSEGGTYGWIVPRDSFVIGEHHDLAVDGADLDRRGRVRAGGGAAHHLRVLRARQGATRRQPAVRVLAPAHAQEPPLGPPHRHHPRDGPAQPAVRAARLPPGRQAPRARSRTAGGCCRRACS